MLTPILVAVTLVASPIDSLPREPLTVPAGTPIPVRFLSPIRSGATQPGQRFEVQTMADVVAGRCVVIPAYSRILGVVDESIAGWFFRHRGRLHLTFEAVHADGYWTPLTAVVEDLEWLPANLIDSTGMIRPAQHSLGHRLLGATANAGVERAALVPLLGLAAAPVGLASSAVGLFSRGPRVELHEGDEGTLRLTTPFSMPSSGPCRPPAVLADSLALPGAGLESLPARTIGGNGAPGDVVNVVLLGTRVDVERAFAHAAWLAAGPGRFSSRVGAATAIMFAKSDAHAPVSSQRLFDRVEDLAFERQGPNARMRHHVRLWAANPAMTMWVGAATEDFGVYITAIRPRITHRIVSLVDAERDLLSRELEAGGCAKRAGLTRIPGSPFGGRNSSGEEFFSDGRAVVVRVGTCSSP